MVIAVLTTTLGLGAVGEGTITSGGCAYWRGIGTTTLVRRAGSLGIGGWVYGRGLGATSHIRLSGLVGVGWWYGLDGERGRKPDGGHMGVEPASAKVVASCCSAMRWSALMRAMGDAVDGLRRMLVRSWAAAMVRPVDPVTGMTIYKGSHTRVLMMCSAWIFQTHVR